MELYHSEWNRNVFKVGEGKNFEFSEKLLPEEDILIVAFYGFSPAGLRRLLGKGEALFGHGDYGIRLVLDLPARPDIVEESSFKIVFREK